MLDIEKIIKENKAIILDFNAKWCGPCKYFAPIFEDVSKDFEDVKFIKIDVDEYPDIAKKYKIRSIPTILAIKNGQVEKTKIGVMSKEEFKEFVKVFIS